MNEANILAAAQRQPDRYILYYQEGKLVAFADADTGLFSFLLADGSQLGVA